MAYNPYIVVPFATWAVAQVAKFAIAAFKGRIDFRYFYASGGMPSVHSAVVCSLATTALLVGGASSPIFGFSLIFAAIVMYDSFGVRRASGEQAEAINMIVDSLGKDKIRLEQRDLRVREILGHQPAEVIIGAVLGVTLAALFNYDKLTSLTTFLQTNPSRTELWVYVGIFGFLVVAGVLQRIILRHRYPKSAAIKRATRDITTAAETVGWLGLVSAVFVYEKASYLAWRFWPLAILAIGVAWATVLVFRFARTVPQALVAESHEQRKQKWLNWGNKRKAKRS